jgi:hemoglobin
VGPRRTVAPAGASQRTPSILNGTRREPTKSRRVTTDAYRVVPAWVSAPDEIDEAMIERLVRAFYGRVRADDVIGPIFEKAIGEDWEPHLLKLCDFWSSVALASGRYKGTPTRVHMQLDQLAPEHFAHWLALFRDTATELCPPAAAAFFIDRAERIAQSLQPHCSSGCLALKPSLQFRRLVPRPVPAK